MLKLSILMHKLTNYSSCTGRCSENIASSNSGDAQEKGKTMNLNLPPQLVKKKLVWIPVILFCKIFIPNLRV
jgi:hypothetical protein